MQATKESSAPLGLDDRTRMAESICRKKILEAIRDFEARTGHVFLEIDLERVAGRVAGVEISYKLRGVLRG